MKTVFIIAELMYMATVILLGLIVIFHVSITVYLDIRQRSKKRKQKDQTKKGCFYA